MDSDFDYLPPPTLQVLSDAVANKMGGNNAGLAIKLRGINHLIYRNITVKNAVFP